uniref:Uncharacterized protein n=1 Tax=Panagrolaimus sp. ES5 TaxID=591445 RepID=A0AC34GWB4_9BILA
MFNRAPRLRFQGRSHSAKEGPMFELGDSNTYNLPEQYNRYPAAVPTHRLLPITPDNKINNSLTPDYNEERRFVRNAGRSSCTSLSPSEDRIRRTAQTKQEEVIKSGKRQKE